MPGIPVKPAVSNELNRQLNHELGAAHSYLAMAAWCEDQNFKGFARYFVKQAGEEQEHARRFMGHLIDRAVNPSLAALPAPRGSFGSLLEVAQHARTMEQSNTAGINAAYEAALAAKDYPAQMMLQWFINEQVEEEANASEYVAKLKMIGESSNAIFMLDKELGKRGAK